MAGKSTIPPPRKRSSKAPPADSSQVQPVTPKKTRIEDELPRLFDDGDGGTHTDKTAVVAPTSVRSTQRATLMLIAGASAGKVFALEAKRTTIGRSAEADLRLTDEGISRIHCAIMQAAAGSYTIEDLASTNGVVVNGQRVKRMHLQSGDRIQLGAEAVLQFGFFDTAEEMLAKQLYEAATRDPLTRALNRRAFDERLAAEIAYAVRHREKLAAIVIDIDHFKSINDTHGHATGDDVLRDVAATIASALRGEDVFARFGGEEFVILARGLRVSHGVKLAERVRRLVSEAKYGPQKNRFNVTVSAGVAELGEHEPDGTGAKLLQLADARLYTAKHGGRNRVVGK